METYQDLEINKDSQVSDELIKQHLVDKFGKLVPEQYQDLEELNAQQKHESSQAIND